LEALEDRIAPSVDTWTGANFAVDKNWSDGANWALGHAPGSSDIAQFTNNSSVKSFTSIADATSTIAGLQIDGSWQGTLNVLAALTLAPGSNNEWDSGSINPGIGDTLINSGTLTLKGTGAVSLGGGGTFQNSGTVNQVGLGGLQLAANGNVATTLTNAGTYNFQADSGIAFGGGSVNNVIVNAGLMQKTSSAGISLIAQPLTNNAGTLRAGTGTLGISANSSNTSGTYQADSGATLDLTGSNSVTFTITGTFTGAGAGKIVLSNGVLALGSAGATFTIPSSTTFQWSGGTISIPIGATLAYNGILTLSSGANVTLGGGGTFQNNGTINHSGLGNLALASNGNTATTLVNTSNGTYKFQADSGIVFGGGNVNGLVVNVGLMEKVAGVGTSVIAQPLNNTGTLDAVTGILQLANNSTNTNGSYEASAGATLDLTGGNTFSETGIFNGVGAGIVTLGGGTFSVYNNAATLTIPGTLTFQWPGGTINVPTNQTLTVNGNIAATGASNEVLQGGGTLTANGTITQSGSGSLLIGGTSTVASTLVLAKGAIYNIASNSGIGFGGGAGGVVTNSGTLEKTAGGGSSSINVTLNNTGGTLAATTGTLTLNTTGGENTGGTFSVSTGAILDLTGGNAVSYSGTYTGSGSGEVLLQSGTLDVTGGTNGATFNLPANLFVWTGGTISTNANNNLTIEGSLKISGATTEFLQGGGSLNIGTATVSGTVNDTGTGNTLSLGAGSTLSIAKKGTFNIADDTISGSGLLSDLGSLTKTGGTGGATIATTVDNQGKVQVKKGTLTFSGTVDQILNGVLTGGSWTAVGSATVAATLTISSATFTTIGLSASVTLQGLNSTFTNLSGLTLNQGSFSLLSGQSFATAGNFTNSGHLTLSPGSVLTVNGNFIETSTGKDTVQKGGTASSPTFGSISTTGTVTLGGTLQVTSTVIPSVGSNFTILSNGSGSANSGTFKGLAQGGTFTVVDGTTTMTFSISYVGGDGDDVVITRIS
jgi:hypothetical protein